MTETPIALTEAPGGYAAWLAEVKSRIYTAQQQATLAVNRELLLLYRQIGRDILARQSESGWGSRIVERLSHDLRTAFPDMKGFSRANLMHMRAFAVAWSGDEIVQQPVGQLPWSHNIVLLSKLKDSQQRRAYAEAAVAHAWSRNVLIMQIETRALDRQGRAVTNLAHALPAPQSDLAWESLKDPYRLDFLGLGAEAMEREIESALVQHVTDFLLELGAGFAFVGRQVHLAVGGEDFYLDLVFYHLKLRHESDGPTIGLLLCKSKNKVVAEYALRDSAKPLGIAEYQLTESLPEKLKTSLPTIEQIERELEDGAS